MPLHKGTGRATVKKNFEEFGKGKTYAHTKSKFGKEKADKQRVAVVLKEKRESGEKKARNSRLEKEAM